MFSIITLISSPSRKTTLGVRITPIPGPVPVTIFVPFSRVVPYDRSAIFFGNIKNHIPGRISVHKLHCVIDTRLSICKGIRHCKLTGFSRLAPNRRCGLALSWRLCGSPMTDGDTRTGPSGQDPSKPFVQEIKSQLCVDVKIARFKE